MSDEIFEVQPDCILVISGHMIQQGGVASRDGGKKRDHWQYQQNGKKIYNHQTIQPVKKP
jgi:hypothetical protein